ncbi:hypothetical protein D3C86_1800160 [compost metagenome]
MRLQGEATLAHTLTHGLHIAGEQAQPEHHAAQHADLQDGQTGIGQPVQKGFIKVQSGKAEKSDQRAARKHPGRQLEHAEQQDHHVDCQQGAAAIGKQAQQQRQPGQGHQHLRFGQAGVTKTQVLSGDKQAEKQQLAQCRQPGEQQRSG